MRFLSERTYIQIVFLCPFVRDLIINVIHALGELARWPHYKSRSPHSRRTNRRLRDSASRWWQRRRVDYQGETRRRSEEGVGAYCRQLRREGGARASTLRCPRVW